MNTIRLLTGLAICLSLSACGSDTPASGCAAGDRFELLWQDDFDGDAIDPQRWEKATHTFAENEAQFRADNVQVRDGVMELSLSLSGNESKPYFGGELRTFDTFTYGRFETRAKLAYAPAAISSFFTFYDEADFVSNWQEIDFEIVGRGDKERQVQANVISNNFGARLEQEFVAETAFAPADDFHTYAFEWTPESVVFFIDGAEVHQSTSLLTRKLTDGQKLLMNLWVANITSWAGDPEPAVTSQAVAQYDYVSVSRLCP